MKPEAPTSRSTLHGWSDYGLPIGHVSSASATRGTGTRTFVSRGLTSAVPDAPSLAIGARGFLSSVKMARTSY
jgi:hypothetical protein